MRALLIVAVTVLAGCSHARIDAVSSTSIGAGAPPAATVSGGSVGVHVHSHSLAALVIAGMFVAAAADYNREPRPMPSFSSFADWFRGAPPPAQPAADRKVTEVDCTQPLPEISGNLKCR
jgi:hypothetical protein